MEGRPKRERILTPLVTLKLPDGTELAHEEAEEFHTDGMFMRTENTVGVGSKLDIQVEGPLGHVQIHGRVVRLKARSNGSREVPVGMGIQFTGLDKVHRAALEALIADEAPEESPAIGPITSEFTAITANHSIALHPAADVHTSPAMGEPLDPSAAVAAALPESSDPSATVAIALPESSDPSGSPAVVIASSASLSLPESRPQFSEVATPGDPSFEDQLSYLAEELAAAKARIEQLEATNGALAQPPPKVTPAFRFPPPKASKH